MCQCCAVYSDRTGLVPPDWDIVVLNSASERFVSTGTSGQLVITEIRSVGLRPPELLEVLSRRAGLFY